MAVAVLASACALLTPAPPLTTATPPPTPSQTPRPSSARTLSYCSPGGQALLLDLWNPPGADKAPLALYVHGGSWQTGNRHEAAFMNELRPALLSRGIAVASIDYRLAPGARWPAQIIDVKCAVRYLRARAGDLRLDPDRFAAWGDSAGGQLVSLAALAGPEAGWDVGELTDRSSALRSVIDLFGPAVLTGSDWGNTQTIERVFGPPSSAATTAALRQASPVTWVTSHAPQFLILHGDQDRVVTVRQSQQFEQALRAAGAPVTLIIVKGGGHGLTDAREEPDHATLVSMMLEFLTRTLSP
jgi:acetyl esterase/lipase